jgi:hypothetical protein
MEKTNADMDVTCKFNTCLEKAFIGFLSHSVRFSFKVCKKWRKVQIRPQKIIFEKNQIRYEKTQNFTLITQKVIRKPIG